MSSSGGNHKNYIIPIEEITRAKQDFSDTNWIRDRRYRGIYRGQLSESWENRIVFIKKREIDSDERKGEFSEELKILTSFHHKNIVPFIGYCYEGNDVFIVQEYNYNGTLEDYFSDRNRRQNLTWAQRLKICITAARGLKHLHCGVTEHGRVIHKDISSQTILLDDNLEAKITGFRWSRLVPGNEPHPQLYDSLLPGNQLHPKTHDDLCPVKVFHSDPIFIDSKILNIESDVYSYGLVLFGILTGTLADQIINIAEYGGHQLICSVRQLYAGGEDELIDPCIRHQIDRHSFTKFTEIAYKCISLNIKDRPTMDGIIKTLEEALEIHNQGVDHTTHIRSLQPLETFLITMKEIKKATKSFSPKTKIKDYDVYKGKLSAKWKNRTTAIKRYKWHSTFHNELQIFSRLHHDNVIPFIGYNDNESSLIIVSEYAVNGRLDDHLKGPRESQCITWEQRLMICIGAARGLKYLHLGFGEYESVIHGHFNSRRILLDDKLEAKIYGFGSSRVVPRNRHLGTYIDQPDINDYYMDPVYRETSILKSESDVYSFGVVLFEILSGMLAFDEHGRGDDEPRYLMNLVRHNYGQRLDHMLIDPNIRDQVDARSLHTFTEIAYKCISFNTVDRPSMNTVVKRIEEALYIQNHGVASTIASRKDQKLEDFKIPLNEINLAIGVKGPETCVGVGGFGKVYRGKLSERWENRVVAIKYLNRKGDQGELNFRSELMMIFSFNHENIIPFIGYCDEGNEKIIVYEYAVNGSLDDYLDKEDNRCCLTWVQRLKICLGAARGLDYLHSGLGEDKRVIHRDVKSGNVLLDNNLEAKICDFGLSRSVSTIGQPHSHEYTNVVGTNYYKDPIYRDGGILRKESDVYSFGVVMFEMLSGMLAYKYETRLGEGTKQPLVNLVRHYYDNRPEVLIDPFIKNEIETQSFNTFKDIAFQCISFNSKERPTMEMIVDRIEEALDFQVSFLI